MDSLSGRTVRWRFDDGPAAGITFDHSFSPDGTVTWRIVDGEGQGASARESPYAATKVNDKTWAISYRGASGHTLTVVLNLDDHRAFAFASNETSWFDMRGQFAFLG